MVKTKTLICRTCGDPFSFYQGKPGYIDQCSDCGKKDVPLLKAKVSWENKHTPVVEVCSAEEADAFNGAQRRFGVSVVRSFGAGVVATQIRDANRAEFQEMGEFPSSKGPVQRLHGR